jgi:hypothetical protein
MKMEPVGLVSVEVVVVVDVLMMFPFKGCMWGGGAA